MVSFHTSAPGGCRACHVISPSYRIDLSSVVRRPLVFEPVGPGGESRVGLPIRSLRFLDNRRLAAAVVTQATGVPNLLSRGAPSAASPFRLDAVLFDASSGKVLVAPSWSSNSRYNWIVAANSAGFVLQTGRELCLLSPGLKEAKRMTLPPPTPDKYAQERSWSAWPSWSARRILLTGGRVWERGPWIWLDAERLRVLRSWEAVLYMPLAVSDCALVMGTGGGRYFGGPPNCLQVATAGEGWRRIPSTVNPELVQFVSPSLLYVHCCRIRGLVESYSALLMRTNGTVILRFGDEHKGLGPGQAAVSRDGSRFVVLVEQTKGGFPALDIGGHSLLRGLLVYDPPVSITVVRTGGSRFRDKKSGSGSSLAGRSLFRCLRLSKAGVRSVQAPGRQMTAYTTVSAARRGFGAAGGRP